MAAMMRKFRTCEYIRKYVFLRKTGKETMNVKERVHAILNYKSCDKMPVVHFGFWLQTLEKWAQQGHIAADQAHGWNDGNVIDFEIGKKLGFDFNWFNCFISDYTLYPAFEKKVLEELADGSVKVLTEEGVIVLEKKDAVSIPAEIDHLLKDRKSWEQHYLPRVQFNPNRILRANVNTATGGLPFNRGGLEYLQTNQSEYPLGLYCGSLFGTIRNWLGVEGSSYLYMDDEKLFTEIIDTVGNVCFQMIEFILKTGLRFDFAHFWEDICYKNGPLIVPSVFNEKVGPHYKRITQLLGQYGITIISLDCDGLIDALIPTWLHNGVNTMFPIEVGTWKASIEPWRQQYGKGIRGVGGMNKTIFSQDYAAVDAEIERLKPLVELGGYIPCPDHRIAPDAKWENVQYYCEKARLAFGG